MSDPVIDFSKIQKGACVTLEDGRTVVITGLYLSSDGPVLMAKSNIGGLVAENIPVSKVREIQKED